MERKSPVNLRVDDAYLERTAEEEGFVAYAYDDADPKAIKTFITEENAHLVKGTLTIGHGHTRTVRPGMQITREEAKSLLRSDVRDAESCVHRYVKVPLTQGEYNGMVDLFFNVGPGRMKGSNGPDDKGKDGIACLGKSGNGRPSTLLTILNQPIPGDPESNYQRASECFTQWRMPGSIFEWGLLKRRVRFMLMFLGLPLRRAVNEFPNAPPLSDIERYNFVQKSIQLAREEKADEDALHTPAADLILTPSMQAKPSAAQAEGKGGGAPVTSPSGASAVTEKPAASPAGSAVEAGVTRPSPPPAGQAGPVSPPATKDPPVPAKPAPAPAPTVSTKPPEPDPKIIIAPKSVDVRSVPYGEIDLDKGAKNMTDSQRAIGLVIVGIGSFIQIITTRLGIGTAIGAIAFDVSRDPATIALVATGVVILIGWFTRKRGTKVMTKGMVNATQLLK